MSEKGPRNKQLSLGIPQDLQALGWRRQVWRDIPAWVRSTDAWAEAWEMEIVLRRTPGWKVTSVNLNIDFLPLSYWAPKFSWYSRK